MKDYKCHESFCKKDISCAQHSVHFSTVINPNNAVFSLKMYFRYKEKRFKLDHLQKERQGRLERYAKLWIRFTATIVSVRENQTLIH